MVNEVSHGRGGAGNINADTTPYVDGEIVRVGPEGSHEDGPFSTGRGGAGNVADTHSAPAGRQDKDFVPEAAVRVSTDQGDFHTGRGGAGNAHLSPEHAKEKADKAKADGKPEPMVSLADKLKYKLTGVFKK